MKNYLVIENGIVVNAVVWDGNTETWTPPENLILMAEDAAKVKGWSWNAGIKDWEAYVADNVQPGIGFAWDGEFLIQPKPANEEK